MRAAIEAPELDERVIETLEDADTAADVAEKATAIGPALGKRKDRPTAEVATESGQFRNKRVKGQETTRRSERIKAEEVAKAPPAPKQGTKRKRVEQVDPNVEKKKLRKERDQKSAKVQESVEEDEPVPKKKGRDPTRGKRKRDDDIDEGEVPKRNKPAHRGAEDAVHRSAHDDGNDGKTVEDNEGGGNSIPKKMRVSRKVGALGKRVREDASGPVEGSKRTKVVAIDDSQHSQQTQDSGKFDEELIEGDKVDRIGSPKRKRATFEKPNNQAGDDSILKMRKRGTTANEVASSKRPCIDELRDILRETLEEANRIEEHELPRPRRQSGDAFESVSVVHATGYWRHHIDAWAAEC
jgi:hypothetical protein